MAREVCALVTDPVENRDITDAEDARDGAKTDVAHCVEKHGQRLHRWRLATRRRHSEIAAARKATIALNATHNPILPMIRSAAALATNLAHGGPLSHSPPRACHQNGEIYLNLGQSRSLGRKFKKRGLGEAADVARLPRASTTTRSRVCSPA